MLKNAAQIATTNVCHVHMERVYFQHHMGVLLQFCNKVPKGLTLLNKENWSYSALLTCFFFFFVFRDLNGMG